MCVNKKGSYDLIKINDFNTHKLTQWVWTSAGSTSKFLYGLYVMNIFITIVQGEYNISKDL